MIDMYEASLDAKYLAHARTLADVILERFIDQEKGGFFFTSDDHEALIMRSKAAFDGSTPSGNSAAAMALLRLYGYTGDERYASRRSGRSSCSASLSRSSRSVSRTCSKRLIFISAGRPKS